MKAGREMLRRRAYERLLDWKRNNHRKALLVDGARQIGKTHLIEEFARREYRDCVKVDFIKDAEAAATLSGARSAGQVIERMSLMLGKAIVPDETLFFFDEVQEFPDIVTFSKYLVEDGRFDVVMSGSLLGVELRHVRSFPVGYLHIEHMFPLDFEEFCWSQSVPPSVLDTVRSCYEHREPVDEALHGRLVDLFRLYLVIGGMPEAVQRFVDAEGDLGAVRDVQTDLVRLYREDISKYAGNRAMQVKAIFDAMPSQLNKENKRFQLKTLSGEAKFERYANDFAWLVGAGAALKTCNVTEPKCMLARLMEEGRFKLYSSDTGMLLAQYPTGVALAALSGSKSVNFGAVYENAVAQALAAAGASLYYYHHSRRGEVDFLLETRSAKVLPIEVKSGKDYKLHLALNNLLGSEEYGINQAVVLSEANVSTEYRMDKPVYYLPLYMAYLVAGEAAGPSDSSFNGYKVKLPSFAEWA